MTLHAGLYFLLYLGSLLIVAKPLGHHLANVFERKRTFLDPIAGPIERSVYRLAGIDPAIEWDWKQNAFAMLLFNFLGVVFLYLLQRLQHLLPLNPQGLGPVAADSAFNTAISFVSNTNWQGYAGETTMSYLTQLAGLTVQNFLSAATGLAVMAIIIRGVARHSSSLLGNFWADLTRSILYILLPLSLVLSLVLVSQGVVQTLAPSVTVPILDGSGEASGATQVIAVGPVASQIAIKQLGTNGGGFFNANASHPYENPTPLSDLVQSLAILLLAAASCFAFGHMVGDIRQGLTLLAAMVLLFIPFLLLTAHAEQHALPLDGIDHQAGPLQPGGNMEGKELRFGIANSALWATATTAASNGSVNAMHDSFMPMGGFATLVLMQLGEVVFGGVGSGLYGMLVFVIVAVFVAGLLVGRTPEYLGHKIEAYEIKMAALLILIMPVTVLLLTSAALMTNAGTASIFNPGPHGFSEVLYAFTSQANNNGSAFAGLYANTPFYNIAGGVAMVIGRYWLAIPAMAMAGALAGKKAVPAGQGTLPTRTPLFVMWLMGIVLVVGALNFLPALALGPIAEQLLLH